MDRRPPLLASVSVLLFLLVLGGCSGGGGPSGGVGATAAPELGHRAVSSRGMVSAAHPAAAEAGIEILRKGGNAVDAAVATAFAVSVGEPQMSGLGGGGSLLIWLQEESRGHYLDFYAAQPAAAFRGLSWEGDEETRLRVVAIPGQAAGLLAAHERFGRLSRPEVVAPAIRIAEEGFPVNAILAEMVARDSAKLAQDPDAAEVFLPGGRPLRPGEILRQPGLAESLRRVAEEGRDGFYRGATARAVLDELRAGGHPADADDLAGYEPRWKEPLRGSYRGDSVLSAPPPQTGLQILHTLALVEGVDPSEAGVPTRSPDAFHRLASALRVGMAAGSHIFDPRWREVPVEGILSDAYAGRRLELARAEVVPDEIDAGEPPDDEEAREVEAREVEALEVEALEAEALEAEALEAEALEAEAHRAPSDPDAGETTHVSVVDGEGNAVALTQTNSSLFGSGARVAGFFLNNSGVDFSRFEIPDPLPEGAGDRGWITRNSTISPTVVLRDGRARLVVGAPGGGRIPTAIVQTMVYHLDYGMDPIEAVRMPRIFPDRGSPEVQTEHGFSAAVLGGARERGWDPVGLSFGYARLYVVARSGDRWIGAADPRHDGEVRGY